MCAKKLFIVQYSEELDQFQLLEVDDPQQLANFEIPIIDVSNGSNIRLSSHLIDTEKPQCSFPNAQVFLNPHNKPLPPIHFGYLYNWFAVENLNFAPPGWHLPTINDFEELFAQVGGITYGGLLKSILPDTWSLPNNYAEDFGDFNLLPSGLRHWYEGDFRVKFTNAFLWARNHDELTYLASYLLTNAGRAATLESPVSNSGRSVRFIKDDDIDPGSFIDIDGNEYPTIKINNQVWLAENWRCSTLYDNTPIESILLDDEWTSTSSPALCAYNNDETDL